jgi:hypothetical protein
MLSHNKIIKSIHFINKKEIYNSIYVFNHNLLNEI